MVVSMSSTRSSTLWAHWLLMSRAVARAIALNTHGLGCVPAHMIKRPHDGEKLLGYQLGVEWRDVLSRTARAWVRVSYYSSFHGPRNSLRLHSAGTSAALLAAGWPPGVAHLVSPLPLCLDSAALTEREALGSNYGEWARSLARHGQGWVPANYITPVNSLRSTAGTPRGPVSYSAAILESTACTAALPPVQHYSALSTYSGPVSAALTEAVRWSPRRPARGFGERPQASSAALHDLRATAAITCSITKSEELRGGLQQVAPVRSEMAGWRTAEYLLSSSHRTQLPGAEYSESTAPAAVPRRLGRYDEAVCTTTTALHNASDERTLALSARSPTLSTLPSSGLSPSFFSSSRSLCAPQVYVKAESRSAALGGAVLRKKPPLHAPVGTIGVQSSTTQHRRRKHHKHRREQQPSA
ncbi:unnamed protein product [Arctogadus glacialis]